MDAQNTVLSMAMADPLGDEALQLLYAFRAEMLARYRDVIGPSGPPPPEDELGRRGICVIASCNGRSVACGALKELDAISAELKRVYVVPEFRRGGIARRLVAELERLALGSGFRHVRLETGTRQPEALALYEACGYARIAPYGRYVGDPMSVCFEKQLEAGENTV